MKRFSSSLKFTLPLIVVVIAVLVYYNLFRTADEVTLTLQYPEIEVDTEAHRIKLEKIFSSDDLKVKVEFIDRTLKDLMAEKKSANEFIHVGVFTTGNLTRADLHGLELTPLYSVSPNAAQECFNESEVAVLENSPLKSIDQLRGKKIGVTRNGVRTVSLHFPEWKKKEMKFGKVILNITPEWTIENLNSKTIDAAILTRSLFEGTNKSKDDLGPIHDGKYVNKSINLKILHTTNFRLPCKMLVVNKNLAPALREKFLNRLKELLQDKKSFTELRELAKIGHLKPVSNEELARIRELVAETSRYSFRFFSDNTTEF